MSVTIRLSKSGRRNSPAYKIVVSNTRDKREGNFLDILGYYNPSETPVGFNLDTDKYNEWINKGALVTDAVIALKDGTYVFKPYDGKKAGKAADASIGGSTLNTAEVAPKVEEEASETSTEEATEEVTE